MRIGLVVPRLLTLIVACGVSHAAERTQGELTMRKPVARFIPEGFVRTDSENSVNLLEDLEPLINSLDAVTPENSKVRDSYYEGKPRRGLERIIETTLSDNQDSVRLSQIQLRVRSYPSFKEAEEGFENTAAMMPIRLKEGSSSGRIIGEVSQYSIDHGQSMYIVFMRRNVVASIAYAAAMEVPKDKKKRIVTTLESPLIADKCERVAKQIDELIISLTNK